MNGLELIEFCGKRALVTGASRQMGRTVAQALASAGVRVVLTGRSLERLHQTRATLCEAEVYLHQTDLREEEDMIRLVERVRSTLGAVDFLIHMAGVGLRAPILLTHMLLPDMVKRGSGRVIVTSDPYEGVEGFTSALGAELRPHGITVNCIAPAIRPEYAVNFLMFLLSSAGDRITGQVLGRPEYSDSQLRTAHGRQLLAS